MYQRFIVLLRAGAQNNARLKPVRSAKTFAYPGVTDGRQEGRIAPLAR